MKRIAFIVPALLLFFQISVFGQQSKADETVEFRPHWYGLVQGGAAYTVGETDFSDLLSPAGALSLGYQFTPVFGTRLNIGGWQGKGNVLGPREDYSFNMLSGNLDLTLDLLNIFGYNHRRVVNPYLFAGGGVIAGFSNGANDVKGVVPSKYFKYLWDDTKFFGAGRWGVGINFRLSDIVSLNVEFNENITSDHLNSKDADNPDFHFNALAGLKFVLGGKPYRQVTSYMAAKEAAKEAENNIKAREPEVKKEEEVRPAVQEQKVEVPVVVEPRNFTTFFALNSSVINKEEQNKLDDFAAWMKANPEFKVNIVGFADKKTGNPSYNLKLSQRRVDAVKNYLVEQGVAAARIVTDYKGDTVQPFSTNEQNRAVIGTSEK